MKRITGFMFFLFFGFFHLSAQDNIPGWFLTNLRETGNINTEFGTNQYLNTFNGGAWATSFFPPDSAAPEDMSHIAEVEPDYFKNTRTGSEATIEEMEKYHIYRKWLKQYAPEKAVDGDSNTAWVENKPDFGKGEILMIDIDLTKPILIWAGFGKSQNLFLKNNRPKDIRVYIIEVESPEGDMFGGTHYTGFYIRAIATCQLKDYNGYQELALPKADISHHTAGGGSQFGTNGHNMLLAIEILSVYPGTDWNDTCITEVKNAY